MDFKPLVTLLAVVNPLAIVPFFIHYTQGFTPAQRRHTVVTAAFSAFLVIATSALLGLQILEFFGISLASFQVGGGMLLLISSMNMLNAQPAEAKPNTNELEDGAQKAAMGASIAVVPLTIPLLTGPATISTVVIYARAGADLPAAVGAGGLRRGDRRGHGLVFRAGRPDRPGAGQDRHQRDDPADGPDPGGAGGGSDGRWACSSFFPAWAVSALRPPLLQHLDQLAAGVAQALRQQLRELDQQLGAHAPDGR